MSSGSEKQKVVVVGAGPVGALAALYAAQRGDEVELYELRGDPRDAATVPLNFTKSINLALSERGINAMRHSKRHGLVEGVLDETIPMYGRMIHGRNKLGDLYETPQAYDVHGRSIHAVDRSELNKRLLDALDSLPNVKFFFNHRLAGADFKTNKAWFEQRHQKSKHDEGRNTPASSIANVELEVDFDFLIGADGAHSAVRYHLMKFARMSYQQEYIDTLWCEFRIAPRPSSSFAMSPNHLHIWPGQEFMFIAIPSLDKSFTCTLFAPQRTFETLSRSPPSALQDFFAASFPGVSPELISPEELVAQFSGSPHLPLISIKCSPYHYGAAAVILGDAAHAMVPFYGQGMNAGLEDVRVLFSLLDAHGVYSGGSSSRGEARASALDAYTATRAPDASTINDLALRNYWEMRAGVTSPVYRARKRLEEAIAKWLPGTGWQTLYSRVSFGNERYSEVQRAVERQGRLEVAGLLAVLGLSVAGAGLTWWRRNSRKR